MTERLEGSVWRQIYLTTYSVLLQVFAYRTLAACITAVSESLGDAAAQIHDAGILGETFFCQQIADLLRIWRKPCWRKLAAQLCA